MKSKRRLFLKRLKEYMLGINMEKVEVTRIKGKNSFREKRASFVISIDSDSDTDNITIKTDSVSKKISLVKNIKYVYFPEGFEIISDTSYGDTTVYYTLL